MQCIRCSFQDVVSFNLFVIDSKLFLFLSACNRLPSAIHLKYCSKQRDLNTTKSINRNNNAFHDMYSTSSHWSVSSQEPFLFCNDFILLDIFHPITSFVSHRTSGTGKFRVISKVTQNSPSLSEYILHIIWSQKQKIFII